MALPAVYPFPKTPVTLVMRGTYWVHLFLYALVAINMWGRVAYKFLQKVHGLTPRAIQFRHHLE